MKNKVLLKIFSTILMFTMIFQISAIALSPPGNNDVTTDIGPGSKSYRNSVQLMARNSERRSLFSYEYRLDSSNTGSFAIISDIPNEGYVWDDTYEISIYDINDDSRKLIVTLHEGQDAYLDGRSLVDRLNKMPTQAGTKMSFKPIRYGTMCVYGEVLGAGINNYTVGYEQLYRDTYRSPIDFEVTDKNSNKDSRYQVISGVQNNGKVEFYLPKVDSNNYVLADGYQIDKINSSGVRVSGAKFDKGSNLKFFREELLKSMNVESNQSQIELILKSWEKDGSIRFNGRPINGKAQAFTFKSDLTITNHYLSKIGLTISDRNISTTFTYSSVQGNLNYPRFGPYGRFEDLGFWWDDDYEITAHGSDGNLKAKVNLDRHNPAISEVDKFPNAFNDKSIALWDVITIKSTRPNLISFNGELLNKTLVKLQVTYTGLKLVN